MGLNDQIFQDFLEKLKSDDDIPEYIISQLETIWNSNEKITKEKVEEIIKEALSSG